MIHRLSLLGLMALIAMLMSACATSYEPLPAFTAVNVDTQGRALRTQNVLVIMDASSSMNEGYQQWNKFDMATAVVRTFSETIPEEMGIQGGLRIFGGDASTFKRSTTLIDDMGDFDKQAHHAAVDTVKIGGPSPLAAAIDAAMGDLEGVQGNTAVMVVTDGEGMGMAPVNAASGLKEKYGEAVCIYPIQVGDDPGGKQVLDAMAKSGGCGFVTSADQLLNGQAMADYVAGVFLGDKLDSDGDGVTDASDRCPGTPAGVKVDAVGCPLDSDKDGVPDYLDKCPGTPAGVTVDSRGCPLDSDGDGVSDALDKCPGTPAGVKVDASGCPVTILDAGAATWTFNNINFETAKAEIQPSSFGILDEVAEALRANPQLRVMVEGHTDSRGARAFNLDLSQRRAQSVVDYLVAKGVAPGRLTAKGYGPDRPVADNGTRLGRAKNRRVQFTRIDG